MAPQYILTPADTNLKIENVGVDISILPVGQYKVKLVGESITITALTKDRPEISAHYTAFYSDANTQQFASPADALTWFQSNLASSYLTP